MTHKDLIEKMARAICCPNGCWNPRNCDTDTDRAKCNKRKSATAALAVVKEWLEGEASQAEIMVSEYTSAPSVCAAECRRLITTLKGETK